MVRTDHRLARRPSRSLRGVQATRPRHARPPLGQEGRPRLLASSAGCVFARRASTRTPAGTGPAVSWSRKPATCSGKHLPEPLRIAKGVVPGVAVEVHRDPHSRERSRAGSGTPRETGFGKPAREVGLSRSHGTVARPYADHTLGVVGHTTPVDGGSPWVFGHTSSGVEPPSATPRACGFSGRMRNARPGSPHGAPRSCPAKPRLVQREAGPGRAALRRAWSRALLLNMSETPHG